MSSPDGAAGCDDADESLSSPLSSPAEQQSQTLSPLSSIPADFRAALDAFRTDWQREVKATTAAAAAAPTTDNNTPANVDAKSESPKDDKCDEDIELMAAELFHNAVELEKRGKVYDALPLYRRAVQLVPDIEFKYYEQQKVQNPTRRSSEMESNINNNNLPDTVESSEVIAGALEEKFAADLADSKGRLILSNRDVGVIATSLHISDLPPEILNYILRWVVSSHLDMRSLENCAAVCKGLYLIARDKELWRLACVKIWGAHVGFINENDPNRLYKSWRRMFIERERVLFHGCYISKASYLRTGENSFQDQYYRPIQLVEYYRYLRFLPDGTVLIMTTADDPTVGVHKLKTTYQSRSMDVKRGRYSLIGNVLTVILKKPSQHQLQPYQQRRQRRGNDNINTNSTQYRMEFRIKNTVKRQFAKLVWLSYSIIVMHNNVENSTPFDITPSKFPPLWFTPVRNYHLDSDAPLA